MSCTLKELISQYWAHADYNLGCPWYPCKLHRDEIAGCSEKAYDSLSVADAKKILMFSSDLDLENYVVDVSAVYMLALNSFPSKTYKVGSSSFVSFLVLCKLRTLRQVFNDKKMCSSLQFVDSVAC